MIALTALLAAACGAEGGKEAETPTKAEGEATPILLQRVEGPEEDAFMESVAVVQLATFPSAVQEAIDGMADQFRVHEESGTRRIDGDAPGLYGGTGDDSVCDLGLLTDHLLQAEDPTKANAFAEALGIPADDLADFLVELTPFVLTTDTLVLNHGYKNGEATPFPAILQAGTAVAVDRHGVPRVKCGCGNPLGVVDGGTRVGADTPTTGERWADFDPEDVTVVEASDDPIEDFTATDTETGEPYETPGGWDGDCYIDPDGHGPDCGDDVQTDPGGDDCYIDPDGHGPDCDDEVSDPGGDDCYIDPDGHGPDCDDDPSAPAGDDCYIDPDGHGPDCEVDGRGGPDDLNFMSGWDADATGLNLHAMITIECPANGQLGEVYGTNPYEVSSSICSAAVHAGRITRTGGGTVGAQIVEGSGPLRGNTANGVTSQPAGNPRGFFEIL